MSLAYLINGIRAVAVGTLRNDGIIRIYAAKNNGPIYEYTYNGSTWDQSTVGTQGSINALEIGTGQNDGKQRLYVACSNGSIYEYTYVTDAWVGPSIGDAEGRMDDAVIGDGRGEGAIAIYGACSDGHVYEFTYSSGIWNKDDIGHSDTEQGLSSITLGDGRDDNIKRVYAGSADHYIYEFTYNLGNGTWDCQDVGSANDKIYSVGIGEARNDSVSRVYGASYDDRIYEFSWYIPTPTPTPPVYVNQVLPKYKAEGKTAKTTVSGQNFFTTPEIKLKHSGWPDVTATDVVVKSNVLLSCAFDLANVAEGLYDLVIKRGGAEHTLTKSFMVLKANNGAVAWRKTDVTSIGVPDIAGPENGIAICDPDNNSIKDVYVTNRNSKFYKLTWLGSAWSKTDLPESSGSEINNDILGADFDKDGISELYAAAQDNHIYRYQGPNWTKTDLGYGIEATGKMNALATGDGNNDGEVELYAVNEDYHLYQLTWNGIGMDITDAGMAGAALTAVVVGDGNNDGHFEIYAAGVDKNIYEFKFNTTWSNESIGAGDGAMTSVVVADIKQSGKQAVYAANEDGKIYEFVKYGDIWNQAIIGSSINNNPVYKIVASDGNNNGVDELYASSGDGHIYQFYFQNNQWLKNDIASFNTPLFGLAIGNGDNDKQHELYVVGENNRVYQLKAISQATPTSTVTITPTAIRQFGGEVTSHDRVFAAPNPIRGTEGKIYFDLAMRAEVEIKIYTPHNQLVLSRRLGWQPAGQNLWRWQIDSNQSNGVYLIRLKARNAEGKTTVVLRKIILIK